MEIFALRIVINDKSIFIAIFLFSFHEINTKEKDNDGLIKCFIDGYSLSHKILTFQCLVNM